MQVYLVGGAVRDSLLNYPVKERDWVVVGTTPEIMLEKGFQQVGKDFPVYLHPKTKEEYALARRERKLKPGYYGFDCDASQTVTLEEDLMRRDLTINALAMDDQGNIIDPYQGQLDLKNKILRHVSDAFIEDPVRVLRVARFAARYAHLGFKLAAETRLLMYKMVKNNELHYLIPERVWQEWERSLSEKNPEEFIKILRSCGASRVIFPEIDQLFGVPNPPNHHPEIDSGVHTLLVLNAAVKLSSDPLVRFASLVHDLGKAQTPIHEWPSHHEHEERGVELINNLCKRLRIPEAYRHFAVIVSRFHLKIHRLFTLKANTIVTTLEKTDAFRRPELFEKLLIACEADSQGRLKTVNYQQRPAWLDILTECKIISAKTLIAEGFEGIQIKEELKNRRIARVNLMVTNWNKNEK